MNGVQKTLAVLSLCSGVGCLWGIGAIANSTPVTSEQSSTRIVKPRLELNHSYTCETKLNGLTVQARGIVYNRSNQPIENAQVILTVTNPETGASKKGVQYLKKINPGRESEFAVMVDNPVLDSTNNQCQISLGDE